jgi:hypothetical protein
MDDKPLPCPFCGRRPSLSKGMRRKSDNYFQKAGEWMWRPAVKCRPCEIDREFESLEEALAWWNTRRCKH